jgi:rsbT co-antagonist protein RsbR
MSLEMLVRSEDDAAAIVRSLRGYEEIVRSLRIGIVVWELDESDEPCLRLQACNPAASGFVGADWSIRIGAPYAQLVPVAEGAPPEQHYIDILRAGQAIDFGEVRMQAGGDDFVVYLIQATPISDNRLCVSFEDITARKRAEETVRQNIAQEATIRAQQAALEELSTPLIPISERVTVMPLIGSMDTRRAQQVMDTLLQGIAQGGAETAILDITGVSIVDTQVANALIRASQAVKLLGARVILTGIRPEVAQTLVSLNIDLGGIITCATLQNGIALALEQR